MFYKNCFQEPSLYRTLSLFQYQNMFKSLDFGWDHFLFFISWLFKLNQWKIWGFREAFKWKKKEIVWFFTPKPNYFCFFLGDFFISLKWSICSKIRKKNNNMFTPIMTPPPYLIKFPRWLYRCKIASTSIILWSLS